MKVFRWMMTAALLGGVAAQAEVPELTALVPEAKEYELIGKLNPKEWGARGYAVDRSEALSGDLKRIGYLLKLTDKADKVSWVFTSMDAFTQVPGLAGVPSPESEVFQTYVSNLEVFSNVDGVKTGKFEKGNIEIWGRNYGGKNIKGIPGATDKFDFGDQVMPGGNYGSFQVHNYLEKQTVFAFNKFTANDSCDLGIGNSPAGNPDWTFTSSARNYKTAELFIVGKFDNLKVSEVVALNPANVLLTGVTDKDPLAYRLGETMTFTLTADLKGQKPTGDYFIKWTRTGDDGRKESGQGKVSDQPVVVRTSLDRPGFVRIYATLADKSGRTVRKLNARKQMEPVFFDGGAAVEPEKLTGTPEPEDFDAFWDKQKVKLAAMPLKFTMDKKSAPDAKVEVYAVTIDCPGPRPVTGYLTIPAGAGDKSLPATVRFDGYGMRSGRDFAPKGGPGNRIDFHINAHGYELGRDADYYREFGESIKSNGQGYAFDPKQNPDPETAYFNGMALRVMRALQFVKQLPQWNGKELVAAGGSQGGLQTIWAAGLDPDVTRALPGIPWCCDLGGAKNFQRLSAGWRIGYQKSMDYYDPINFAKRIRCMVEVPRAGLGDYTCPPSGVAVFYNNLKCPKKITWYQGSTHGYVPPNPQKIVRESK